MDGIQREDAGFSLVEIVIAMLVLGLIAVALLPVLWQGLRFSIEQASAATATRGINALVEQARTSASCTGEIEGRPVAPNEAAFPATFSTGRGETITVDVQDGYECINRALVRMELTARDESGDIVSTSLAEVFTDASS